MQKIIPIIILTCTCLFTNAQETAKGKIAGKIADSASATPIEYATITLYEKGNKKALTGTTSDNSGHFILTGIADGIYTIIIESVSYQPFTLNDVGVNKKNGSVDLHVIGLQKRQSTLQNVTVTAGKGLIESKIDKLIFNAEKDITSQGGVATDILKKVPQVSVDADGNVELAGSSSIRFLINGKPSSAFGSNIADVLQSIPASQIKSIEVITNPGAKYDAEGLGGIINIILKQNRARGINGNLSLTAGTRMENGSFNLTARRGNLGLNAFVSGNERLSSATPSISERLSADTISKTNSLLQQQGDYRFTRYGYQSGFGFDWVYRKKNNFTGSLNYNNFGNTGTGLTNQLQVRTEQASGNIISSIASVSHTHNDYLFQDINVNFNYKRTFDKEDKELEIAVNSGSNRSHFRPYNYQVLMPQDSLFYGTKSDNPGRVHETEIKMDYTLPLKKDITLGTGGKYIVSNINSRSDVYSFQPASGEYGFDNSLSNYLTYRQKIVALYAEISFPVFQLFDAKIGGRFEHTDINSFYSNAQAQAHTPGYNTLVPSIFFSKKLDDNQTIKLSYSKRIERPDYGDLNPFVNTNDPKNISAGNPYLQPEIGHRFEFSYNRNAEKIGSFMVTAFYRINDHDIQPYIVFYPSLKVGDSIYNSVAVSTRQNIGSERNAGISLFADLHISSKFNIRSNLFAFHRHTINALDAGYNSNSFNYRFNLNTSYQFRHNYAAEFFGNFSSARNEVQGKYPSFTSYSFALRKQSKNKKTSIALTANNIFGKYVDQRTILYGPNFSVNSLRQIPFRSIGINFTWKFGKLEFSKEKEEGSGNLNAPTEG